MKKNTRKPQQADFALTFFQGTDWAYLNWNFTDNLFLSAGKQVVAIGGWEYITSEVESTSRGLIVFRRPDADNIEDAFAAYDRMPPNYPNTCTDSHGNTTRMVVDFPFVVDRCNNAYYSILNGQIIIREPDMTPNFPTDGEPVYPLIQYHTQFDGNKLVISN